MLILENETKGGIWIIWSDFEVHSKKVCEGTDRSIKLTERNKDSFFRKGLSILVSPKMLVIEGGI